jgi:hypothetical protein
MGALTEGYIAARTRQDEQTAEIHRKEEVVDHELHLLGGMLSADAQFLKDNDVAFEYSHNAMRVSHRRSPVATIHYSAESQSYGVTIMKDGSQRTPKTTEECARALGEILFGVIPPK